MVMWDVVMAFWCTEGVAEVATERVVCFAHPLSWAFWNCPQCCSNVLQCCKNAEYVSCVWFCSLIQSLALWNFMACCNNIIVIASLGWWSWNLQLLTNVVILVFKVYTCLFGTWQKSLLTSSIKCQNSLPLLCLTVWHWGHGWWCTDFLGLWCYQWVFAVLVCLSHGASFLSVAIHFFVSSSLPGSISRVSRNQLLLCRNFPFCCLLRYVKGTFGGFPSRCCAVWCYHCIGGCTMYLLKNLEWCYVCTWLCCLPMVLQRCYCWCPMVLWQCYCCLPMVLWRGYSFLPMALWRGDAALAGTFLCSSRPDFLPWLVVSRALPLKLWWLLVLACWHAHCYLCLGDVWCTGMTRSRCCLKGILAELPLEKLGHVCGLPTLTGASLGYSLILSW